MSDHKPEDIKITQVNPTTKQELTNISDNLGIPLAAFLKPKLREIADSYPAHMKEPVKK